MIDSWKMVKHMVIWSKYARYLPEEKRRETFDEILERNKAMHVKRFPFLEKEIDQVYDDVRQGYYLPSMRSLQFAGPALERHENRMYNCVYFPITKIRDFRHFMFLLLGGSGVGYSIQKHHIEKLIADLVDISFTYSITRSGRDNIVFYEIQDSIEGWADAVEMLFESWACGKEITFDYSKIRPKGSLLKTAGGLAPGPEPLKKALDAVQDVLGRIKNPNSLKPIDVFDILCHLALAVYSGGIRRAATIAFFDKDDQDMLSAKSGNWYDENGQRAMANISAVLIRDKTTLRDYVELTKMLKDNKSGEPGFYWTWDRELLSNPCGEVGLKANTFCNLIEGNKDKILNLDPKSRLGIAKRMALLAVIQSTYTQFPKELKEFQKATEEDNLLGISLTGWTAELTGDYSADVEGFKDLIMDASSYWADTFGLNQPKRITTLKPSGTSSLVLGTSAGIHPYYAPYYLRRFSVGKNEALCKEFIKINPDFVEDKINDPDTAFIKIPLKAHNQKATTKDISAMQQLRTILAINKDWIDGYPLVYYKDRDHRAHNISATIYVKEHEWDDVLWELWQRREEYRGVTLFPYDDNTYTQAPHEEIDEQTYQELISRLKPVEFYQIHEDHDTTTHQSEIACAGGACEIRSL